MSTSSHFFQIYAHNRDLWWILYKNRIKIFENLIINLSTHRLTHDKDMMYYE